MKTLALGATFFAICWGFGYASLNRFAAPELDALSDTIQYHQLVTDSPNEAIGHWRYRILLPYLAKPIYNVTQGTLGTWNSVAFSLLVISALFAAGGAVLLVHLSTQLSGNSLLGVLVGFLFLCNFAVVNVWMVGLIDSGEAFFLLTVVYFLRLRRWWMLPMIFIAGALAKETFVPIAAAFSLAWLLADEGAVRSKSSWLAWLTAVSAGVGTISLVQSYWSGEVVWLWSIVASERSSDGSVQSLAGALLSRNFWYFFAWLLPLGVVRLARLPRTWLFAGAAGGSTVLLLSAFAGAPGSGMGRALYSCVGPLLCYSAALWLGPRTPTTSPE